MRRQLLIALIVLFAPVAWAASAHATGKTLTYALYTEPDTLDAVKMATDVALHPAWLVCDALVNLSKDGQRVEPGLAESWTTTSDGLLATMRIRSGVQFHDGTPLDAAAVRTSVERHIQPVPTGEPRNSREQLLRELIDHVNIQDHSTIVFKLKYPGLHYLSQIDIVSPTAAARLGNSFGRQPVCSGPFKFESWTRGDRLVVSANDRYWRGRPRIDRVVFRFINEPASLVDAMARGEVDFSPHVVDPIHFEKIRGSVSVSLVRNPALNITYLGFDVTQRPFNDPRVRRAIAQALDLERMTAFLGRGAVIPARGPLAPAVKGHDPTVKQAGYEPLVAKAALAKAGFGGRRVRLIHHEGYTIHAEVAGAIQNDLRRAGVTVDLVGKASFGDLLSAVRAQEGEMFVSSWNVRGPYPERILFPLFHSRSVPMTNLMHYGNSRLDALLEEALRLPDGPTQRHAYSQAQQLIVDDAPMVFLYHATRIAAVAKRVQGIEVNLGSLPYDKLISVDLLP